MNSGDGSAGIGSAMTLRCDIADAAYMCRRLERVVELLNAGNVHMAVAKLLADISALRALLAQYPEANHG